MGEIHLYNYKFFVCFVLNENNSYLRMFLPEVVGGQPRLEDGEGLVVALPLSSQLIPSAALTGSSCLSWLWHPLRNRFLMGEE